MTPRRLWTWLIFWAGVVVVLTTLSWASYAVYQLEERNAEVRAMAQRQELIQRALWRIDSRIAPIIALESSRPYSDYEQLQVRPFDLEIQPGMQTNPDQQLAAASSAGSYVTQYFQFDPQSPPPGEEALNRQLSSTLGEAKERVIQTESTTLALDEGLQAGALLSARESDEEQATIERDEQTGYDYQARKAIADIVTQNSDTSQSRAPQRSQKKLSEDGDSSAGKTELAKSMPEPGGFAGGKHLADEAADFDYSYDMITNSSGAEVSGFAPRWVLDESSQIQLVLVRTVRTGDNDMVQGVMLDWESMNADLLESITDILPTSQIIPSMNASVQASYPLATIPASFIPGGAVAMPAQSITPAIFAMLVTWIAIVVSIAAIGIVLRAALNLSDRRGRFVTAVTHELRTPLTTFRLYAQMLADGMVPDDIVRAQYLTTLKRESERLTGIVENVLEYARLSHRRSSKDKAAGVQTLTPDALLVRFRPTLSRRCEQSNMDLVTSIDLDDQSERTLTVDPNAVERIMLNLIENACKYAAPPEDLSAEAAEEFDTRVHLDVTVSGGMLELLVADHGGGIDPKDRGRVFGEFQRGSRRLVLNRSGLGLGLALSRGLAREMGGDLELVVRRRHGAEFLVTIPLDDPPASSQNPESD